MNPKIKLESREIPKEYKGLTFIEVLKLRKYGKQ